MKVWMEIKVWRLDGSLRISSSEAGNPNLFYYLQVLLTVIWPPLGPVLIRGVVSFCG